MVNLLAIEDARDLLGALRADRRERLFAHREHAAHSAGAVVERVCARLDLGLDGEKHEVRHQSNGVARSPVFACLLVILLVKLADQFLEDRTHRVVIDACWGEVDVGVEKLVI
jgi:hypothetical protein